MLYSINIAERINSAWFYIWDGMLNMKTLFAIRLCAGLLASLTKYTQNWNQHLVCCSGYCIVKAFQYVFLSFCALFSFWSHSTPCISLAFDSNLQFFFLLYLNVYNLPTEDYTLVYTIIIVFRSAIGPCVVFGCHKATLLPFWKY